MFYDLQVTNVNIVAIPTNPFKMSEISGTISTISEEVKRVVLLNRDTLELVGSTIVNDDNTWIIRGLFTSSEKLIGVAYISNATGKGTRIPKRNELKSKLSEMGFTKMRWVRIVEEELIKGEAGPSTISCKS